jgi:integrase
VPAERKTAVSPAQRLVVALAAVHAARPKAIRELTLDDIDLPNRRITIAGHPQPLGDLTRTILLAWLEHRRITWPRTANRHLLISRVSASGTESVAADYLDKHLLLGAPLERIRRDRILQEALATGADPLHLTLIFNIDHTTAMSYADAARKLLGASAEHRASSTADPRRC